MVMWMSPYLDARSLLTDKNSSNLQLAQELMHWFLLSLIVLSLGVHGIILVFFPEQLTSNQLLYCFAPIYSTLLLSYSFLKLRRFFVSMHIFLMGMVLAQFLIILFVTGHMTYVYVSYTNVVLVAGLMIGPISGFAYTSLIVFCVSMYHALNAFHIVSPVAPVISEDHVINVVVTSACFVFTGVTVALFVIKRAQLHQSLIKEKERSNQTLAELEKIQELNEQRFTLGVLTGWLGQQLTSTRYAQEFITASLAKIYEVLGADQIIVVTVEKKRTDMFVYDPAYHTVLISNFEHQNAQKTWQKLKSNTKLFIAEKMEERLAEVGEDNQMYFQEIMGSDGPFGAVIAFAPIVSHEKEIFLGTVANMFSSAFAREQAEEQLRHLQKMKALNLLAGGIAHDFNNLLMSIMTNNEIALSLIEPDSELEEFLRRISWATDQGSSLTRKLLSFNKKEIFTPEVIDIVETIRDLEPILEQICTNRSQLSIDAASQKIFVFIDKKDFESAILNLCINARDAIDEAGKIHVRIRLSDDHSNVNVIIQDTGTGIPLFMLDSIFEPFVSTKSNGTGLGLTMVRSMVDRGKGSIHVDSSSEGSIFTLSFPICSSEDFEKQFGVKKEHLFLQKKVIPILVLDDDRLLLSSVSRILGENNFCVYQAESVVQAKNILLEHEVKLVLSDINMPGESGIDFYHYCLKQHPDIVFLLMTGRVVQEDFPDAPIIEKPISAQDIIVQLNKALKRYT